MSRHTVYLSSQWRLYSTEVHHTCTNIQKIDWDDFMRAGIRWVSLPITAQSLCQNKTYVLHSYFCVILSVHSLKQNSVILYSAPIIKCKCRSNISVFGVVTSLTYSLKEQTTPTHQQNCSDNHEYSNSQLQWEYGVLIVYIHVSIGFLIMSQSQVG